MDCYINLKIERLISSNKELLIKKCQKYKINTNGEKTDIARRIAAYEEYLFLKKYNFIENALPKITAKKI